MQNIARVTHPFADSPLINVIKSDEGNNFINIAEQGVGLMCLNNKSNIMREGVEMVKLPDICDELYTKFNFQANKRSKDDPFVQALHKEYKNVMNCNSLTEAIAATRIC